MPKIKRRMVLLAVGLMLAATVLLGGWVMVGTGDEYATAATGPLSLDSVQAQDSRPENETQQPTLTKLVSCVSTGPRRGGEKASEAQGSSTRHGPICARVAFLTLNLLGQLLLAELDLHTKDQEQPEEEDEAAVAYQKEKRREELLTKDQHELRAAMGLHVSSGEKLNIDPGVTLSVSVGVLQEGVVLPGIDELNAKELPSNANEIVVATSLI